MLVAGYFGEAVYPSQAQIWGLISGIAYFVVVYDIWIGGAAKLAAAAGGSVLKAHKALCWFVLVGWAIYPIGYVWGYAGGGDAEALNIIYNLADFINKIAFGVVIWVAATSPESNK